MIIDKLSNFEKYLNIHPAFASVLDNIEKYSNVQLETGKYPIDGDDVFAVVNHYDTKEAEEDKFENHKKYIDIQCVLTGCEEIAAKAACDLKIAREYDEGGDYEMYSTPATYHAANLCAGEFAIFFPDEAHRPGVAATEGVCHVDKVIFKVKL